MQVPLEIYEWLVKAGIIGNAGNFPSIQAKKMKRAMSPYLLLLLPTLTMDFSLEK